MFFSGSQMHTELDTLLLTSPAGREPCPLVEVPVILEEGVDPPGACRLMNLAKCSNILCAVSPTPFGVAEYFLPQLGVSFYYTINIRMVAYSTPYTSILISQSGLAGRTRDVRESGAHRAVTRDGRRSIRRF